MKKEIVIGVVIGAILAGGGLFFSFQNRVSRLEAKYEDIPSKGELKKAHDDIAKVDQKNALNDFPIGAIFAMTEKEFEIPEGWAICDGTKGTPNLSNTFLMGVSSKADIGNRGGIEQIKNAGAHPHSGKTNVTSGPDHGIHCSGNCAGYRTSTHAHDFTTGTAGAHTHGDNRPPYLSVIFIMKIQNKP